MSDKHHRRSIRLNGYDYAQPGAYFITVCTRDRACLFGHVVNGEMHLNEAGEIAQRCWEDLPRHFPFAELDAFVMMPNHVHGIIVITEPPVVRGSEIVIPCKGEASVLADTSGTHASPLRQRPGMCTGEKSFAPTDDHATPQSPSKTIGSIVRGSEIVIPCKGEASVLADTSGMHASPLRQRPIGTQSGSLSAILQNFKSISTRKINAARGAPGTPVWQRNYYEHVVRNEAELMAIRQYIQGNPARWDDDENNPLNEVP